MLEALREAGGGEIPVVVGGIIPEADAEPLRAAGVAAVYTPKDFELTRILRDVVGSWRSATGSPPRREPSVPQRGRPLRDTLEAAALGARLRERDLSAAPAALNLLENRAPARREEIAALLAEVGPARLGGEAPAHVVGVTGPPGAGKSTLLSALVRVWRERGRTVGVLAVDPSSKRSGGALLGDRARIDADPADRGLFIRSMAAGERLGGLAPATRAAAQALAAAFDVVVVETVGVGQSETEVAEAADTVAVVVQPGSGDVLQFLKAGIMEVPDVLVVTKSDLGTVAQRAVRDLRAALRSLGDGAPVVAGLLDPPGRGDRGARRRARRAPRGARPERDPHARAPARRAGRLRRRARRARPARARRPPRRRALPGRAGRVARGPGAGPRARGARGAIRAEPAVPASVTRRPERCGDRRSTTSASRRRLRRRAGGAAASAG